MYKPASRKCSVILLRQSAQLLKVTENFSFSQKRSTQWAHDPWDWELELTVRKCVVFFLVVFLTKLAARNH
jgi:hypothetical protein